ncbi:hypothetical protein QDK53_07900 [Amycolatopsis magusensis]|nr:hypothetical protein [Amycolatopsis magusensis]MDI5976111.1 hypothetical protein [Amycolatopsis magusensis]
MVLTRSLLDSIIEVSSTRRCPVWSDKGPVVSVADRACPGEPGAGEAERGGDPLGQQAGEGAPGHRFHDADEQLEAGVGVAGFLPGGRQVLWHEMRMLLLSGDPQHVFEAPRLIPAGAEVLVQAGAGATLLEVVGQAGRMARQVANGDRVRPSSTASRPASRATSPSSRN